LFKIDTLLKGIYTTAPQVRSLLLNSGSPGKAHNEPEVSIVMAE